MEAASACLAAQPFGDGALDRLAALGDWMSVPVLLFFAFACVAVLGALLMILAREPIHSALALVLVMIALAALYLLLGAEFTAAVQIIVYAGAIMVLFVFVIMLLNAGQEERTNWSKVAPLVGLPLGIFLLFWIAHWMAHSSVSAEVATGTGAITQAMPTNELSKLLFSDYVFPFEATSILILIAILGAMVLAKKDE
jgi:NADH-quinone oxidoreductase subunit J